VRWGNPDFAFTHAKVIIADGDASVISTGNYVLGQVKADRNFVVVDKDPEDVAALTALFDADWARKPLDARCERLVISPDNARGRILRLIESAERTLDVESMELGDASVRHALADRRAAGVRVRVVLADPWWVHANDGAARYLAANKIRARYLVSPSVHAKAIVADGERAYVGSVNMSWTSLTKSREIGVIADEPEAVATISATLARDWSAAIGFVLPPKPDY
jgi:phosphatidylserine/phosphatidylglycerophosphate/cardiolipin synthase-like enzyme